VNTGGSKVDNLVLSDQLNGVGTIQNPPAAPQFVITSTQGSCSQSGQLVKCNGGTLAGGGTWVVTIRGVVIAPNGSTLNNTASVTGTRSAQNFTTAATAQTLVANAGGGSLPDLTINKTGPSTVEGGTQFNYVLTVNNIGTSQATNIKVVDTLPPLVGFVSASPTSLFTCSPSVPTPGPVTVVCTGGSVNAGQNATITIRVTAPPAPNTLTNTASVDPDNSIVEGNELNNTSAVVNTQVTSTPSAPLLAIVKTDDPAIIPGAGPDPVQPLQNITYKIRVTNDATSRADDVVVVDGTQGLEAASISATQVVTNGTVGTGNGCVVTAPQVRCNIRSLNAGGVLNITLVGKVIAPSGTNIINTATVTGNIKNVGVTNSDSELTTDKPTVDLNITKADNPDPVCASSWPGPDSPTSTPLCQGGLKYTFVVGNSGLAAATNVVVRDVLPAGVIYDSYGNVGGADFLCPAPGPLPADNALVCTNASIGPESTESFFIVVVPPPTTGTITNVVTVDPNNAIFESDETNNSFSITTQVATGIDLVVYKFDKAGDTIDPPGPTPAYPGAPAGFDPIATSGTQTYTIRVDNIGTQDATGVRVRDTLPAGTKFLSAQGDDGFTCQHNGAPTGGIVECTGGHLLGTASEFYDPPPAGPGGGAPAGNDFATITIKVFARPDVGTMHNEVRVDPDNEIVEFNELNNLAVQDTVVTNGDGTIGAFNELSIVKTQTDPPGHEVATSSTVTYQIVVTNTGTDPAVNVKVRDILPAGFQFGGATDITTGPGSDPLDFLCSQSGNVQSGFVVDCAGATLDGTGDAMGAGVPNTRTIQIKATSASQPGSYTNQAIVDPDAQIPEGNETNNNSSVVTTVKVGTPQGFVDLRVDKTQIAPAGDVVPGGDITYQLHVKNFGTDPAFHVVVRDALPANTAFVSAADVTGGPGAFSCAYVLGPASTGGTVTCTNGTLDGSSDLGGAAPEERNIEIRVTAPAIIATPQNAGNVSAVVTNQAVIDPDDAIGESDETNNSSQVVQTTVRPKINLKLTKEGPTQASQNQEADYKIEVTNETVNGGATAFGVVVTDKLPPGVIPLSITAEPGNFQCQLTENPVNGVTCSGDLTTGTHVTITIHVFITQASGTMDNEACVDRTPGFSGFDPGNIAETNETDNCQHAISAVGDQAPNLLINKIASTATVTPGQALTYTITVSNVGNAATTSQIKFEDTIPSVVTLGVYNSPNGFTCSTLAGPKVECTSNGGVTLAPGAFTQLVIPTTVNTSGLPSSFTNTATITSAGDPHGGPAAVTTSVGASGFDLEVVSLDDTPDPVAPGGIVTYTAVVTNNGTSNASGVQVRTELTPDAGITLTHVNSAGSNGFACTFAVTVDCTGNLPPSGTTTITMQFQVAGTVPPDKKVTVTTTVDPTSAFAESDETNNSKTTDTTVHANCSSCVDLVMGDIVDSPDPVARDSIVTYVIGVGNGGDTQSGPFDIVLTVTDADDIDFGGSFDTTNGGDDYAATAGFNCTALAKVVTCNDSAGANDGLAPGEGVLITLKVHVIATATHPFITLQAQADPSNAVTEFSDANNDGSESTGILP